MQLADALGAVAGVEILTDAFFNEFSLKVKGDAATIVDSLADKGILGGVPVSRLAPDAGLDDVLLVAATEANTQDDIAAFATALKEVLA